MDEGFQGDLIPLIALEVADGMGLHFGGLRRTRKAVPFSSTRGLYLFLLNPDLGRIFDGRHRDVYPSLGRQLLEKVAARLSGAESHIHYDSPCLGSLCLAVEWVDWLSSTIAQSMQVARVFSPFYDDLPTLHRSDFGLPSRANIAPSRIPDAHLAADSVEFADFWACCPDLSPRMAPAFLVGRVAYLG